MTIDADPGRFERRLKNSVNDDIRVELLRILDERPATLRELADMLGEELSSIAPHVFELWSARSIDSHEGDSDTALADRPLRATKVYYDDAEWEELQEEERLEAAARILEGIIGESMSALRSGHLTARFDTHLSWTPMIVDEEGWRETMAMLARALTEAEAIRERSIERLSCSEEQGFPVVVSMMGFERSRGPAD
jgi:DNA-binding MarR family transcriptional regulator